MDPRLQHGAPYPWRFTCTECTKPGGAAYREKDAAVVRGLLAGTGDYWDRNAAQLAAQTVADAPAEPSPATPTTAAPSVNWHDYQKAVLASPTYPPQMKFAFMVHTRYADHRTGGNCRPSLEGLAAASGLSVTWWEKMRSVLQHAGLMRLLPCRAWRRTLNGKKVWGWGPSLVVWMGHGFDGPTTLRPSASGMRLARTPRGGASRPPVDA